MDHLQRRKKRLAALQEELKQQSAPLKKMCFHKVGFDSYMAALKEPSPIKLRIYRCPHCKRFHRTSKV